MRAALWRSLPVHEKAEKDRQVVLSSLLVVKGMYDSLISFFDDIVHLQSGISQIFRRKLLRDQYTGASPGG